MPNSIKNKFNKVKTFNFGAGLKQNNFNFKNNGAIIPKFYTFIVCISCSYEWLLQKNITCWF